MAPRSQNTVISEDYSKLTINVSKYTDVTYLLFRIGAELNKRIFENRVLRRIFGS
jgi:DNA-binding transcriptional regulator WhiA